MRTSCYRSDWSLSTVRTWVSNFMVVVSNEHSFLWKSWGSFLASPAVVCTVTSQQRQSKLQECARLSRWSPSVITDLSLTQSLIHGNQLACWNTSQQPKTLLLLFQTTNWSNTELPLFALHEYLKIASAARTSCFASVLCSTFQKQIVLVLWCTGGMFREYLAFCPMTHWRSFSIPCHEHNDLNSNLKSKKAFINPCREIQLLQESLQN